METRTASLHATSAPAAVANVGLFMPTPEEQYWEQEYLEFEDASFQGDVFWRVPAHALRGTELFHIFERLCARFPHHPHDHNTVFYLFKHVGVSPKHYTVLLRCSRFEHSSPEFLGELANFLAPAASCIGENGSASVELLDGSGAGLHVRFYSPREGIVRLLQERATRVRSSPAVERTGAPPCRSNHS